MDVPISKNLILESIKGRNSVANLRKQQFTLLTLILSMMMCIQNWSYSVNSFSRY